ncbi:ABC transporter ATP-binding protein (plasmid) [Herbiconiux sp. KACC 21604]|uniref:ATP-binding cassette domain-containing protein n=1 Tax=unclassified Herbiconiux TaxID=2618217 RepID=UPI001492F388|nr:ABC transporter ATP-binding protein [Herbiconiux sp. SALV-R1]QJU56344.1 ABC transporter ATP-binding protein [Herbiconiux sp. SALV-R1]WPO88851.1 ABC transporter ATP-binding protein [Herbiconiux sp. KACC 21604]
MSLDVEAGDIVGLVGESGSGKSTLASAVMGLLPANAFVTSGRVLVDGTDISHATPSAKRSLRRNQLGLIPQNPITSLDPTQKIRHSVKEVIDDAAVAAAMLQSVGFTDPQRVLGSYPHQLSGGMAQRVAIAMAVARRPVLLVADEPTSALDAHVADNVLSILTSQVKELGMSLLIVTHDLEIVRNHCARVAVMNRGSIVESGPTAQILRNPQHAYTKQLLTATQTLHAEERVVVDSVDAEPAIEIREATVTFTTGPPWAPVKKNAVENVSLTIDEGEMVGLVGPSGSGKTTITRLLLGLQKPKSGQVLMNGRPLMPPRKGTPGSVQVVLQHPDWALNPSLRVGTSIAEPLAIAGRTRKVEARTKVSDLMERMGLDPDLAERYPHELSGGQRQRASIARALIARPRLIVFDEAVSSLDVSVQAQVLRLIRDVQKELGFASLFVSHDLGAVAFISHRVVHMADGAIVSPPEFPERNRP